MFGFKILWELYKVCRVYVGFIQGFNRVYGVVHVCTNNPTSLFSYSLRKKVAGAIAYCSKRKLTKKCLYSGDVKYLVLVDDKVEAGASRQRLLEQEMAESGIWDTDFQLGDLINLDDESEGKGGSEQKEEKKRLPDFPVLEGSETLQEYLGQYKKACLNKKAALKAVKDKLLKDQAKGHESLGLAIKNFFQKPMSIMVCILICMYSYSLYIHTCKCIARSVPFVFFFF